MSPASDHLAQLMIAPDTPIMAAVSALSQISDRILLVAEPGGPLLGIVTDYDIRQALLKQVSFDRPVSTIMKREPVVVSDSATEEDIADRLRKTGYAYVPVIDRKGRPVAVRFEKEFVSYARPRHGDVAVVMAGGFGTRLRPLTNEQPKPLLHVGGRPILFILLDQLINEQFEKIYLTLHYRSHDIVHAVSQVERYRERVEFVIEPEPLGTAGALGLLPEKPKKPFLVMNADLLTEVPLRELMCYHAAQGNALTMATREETFTMPYGAVEVNGARVVAVREKPSYKMQVNIGVYALDPKLLDELTPRQRLDMPDIVNVLVESGQPVGHFPVHEYWLDIGTHDQYRRAQEEFTCLKQSAPAE